MKSILIIGLSHFGIHMALKLDDMGNEVMVIDTDEGRVNEILPHVTNAQIGDATDYTFMSTLGIRNFNLCVVAVGDNFQSSLETTTLLKELGAKFVLAKASSDIHAKFLLKNGADQIVYTERATAERLAIKFGSDNIFDYIELTNDYSIYEIPVPSAWVGKSILEKEIRTKHKISILAIKANGSMQPLPNPDHVFTPTETLMILGHNDDIRKFLK